jgi:hypothetical protein
MTAARVLFWRRTDIVGLERLVLTTGPDGVTAESTVLSAEAGGLRLDHHWRLDPSWRAFAVTVERWNADGHGRLLLERAGGSWRVNGAIRPDLDGAAEPDLSVTPFCNTLPIRRLANGSAPSLTLDTAYVDGPALTVTRSRQRYDRLAPDRFRYVDLGVAQGFVADLVVDGESLVLRYQHLFESIVPES